MGVSFRKRHQSRFESFHFQFPCRMKPGIICWILWSCFCFYITFAARIPCSATVEPIYVNGLRSYFEIMPLSASVYASVDGKPDETRSSFGFNFLGTSERERNQVAQLSTCLINQNNITATRDNDGNPLGNLVKFSNFTDMECETEKREDYPHPGIVSVVTTLWEEGRKFGDIVYSLSNTSKTFVLSNDTQYTNGTTLKARYSPDSLKITIAIEDFVWEQPTPPTVSEATFATLWVQYKVRLFQGLIKAYDDSEDYKAVYTAPDYSLFIYFDKSKIVDGVPYADFFGSDQTAFSNEIPDTGSDPVEIVWLNGVNVCDTLNGSPVKGLAYGHWSNLTYDPQLGILFGKKEDGTSKSKVPAAAIGASVGAVVAAVAIFLVFSILYTPLYKKLYKNDPFGRLNKTKTVGSNQSGSSSNLSSVTASELESPENGWKVGKKGTI